MEMEEIVKLLIVVFVLILTVGLVIYFFKGEGGDLLSSLKHLLRLGK